MLIFIQDLITTLFLKKLKVLQFLTLINQILICMNNHIKLNLIFITLFFSFPTFAQYPVGHYNVTFQDPDRANRSIETEIYYPASSSTINSPIAIGDFPVIVFGHGFVMSWDSYENLWEELVPRGYIMAFPKTEGNIFSTDHQQFGWDLQFLVTKLQNEGNNSSSPLFNGVNNNTALMGHSMGGGASFLAADSLCINANNQLKTIIGLAPAESTSNGVSSINSASSITVPALIFSGSQDGVTPPNDHHLPIYNSLSSDCKTFISITGGGHCYFANSNFNCDFGESTSSSGISLSRAEQHDVTFDFLNLWLNYTLKNDCIDFNTFQDSLSNSNRITNEQICSQNPIPNITENGGILTCNISGIGYQWYLDNNIINGANSINLAPSINGNYTVEVSFLDGCPTTSSPFNISTNNILDNLNQKVNIYPNPTYGNLSLKFENVQANLIVNLRDLSGKLISIQSYKSTKIINYDLKVKSGIYILELINNDGNFSRIKIVKN